MRQRRVSYSSLVSEVAGLVDGWIDGFVEPLPREDTRSMDLGIGLIEFDSLEFGAEGT